MYELLISIANYQIPMVIRITIGTILTIIVILTIINTIKQRRNHNDIPF